MAYSWSIVWASQKELNAEGQIVWHELHNPRNQLDNDRVVLEPELSLEIGAPGSLTFSLPVTHPDYYTIKNLRFLVTIEVRRVGANGYASYYWAGHPLSIEQDMYGNLQYTCEGVLGLLADAYLRPFSGTRTAKAWMSYFLGRYDRALYETSAKLGDAEAEALRYHRSFYGHHVSKDLQHTTTAEVTETAEGTFETKFSYQTVEEARLTRWTEKNLTVMEAIKTRLVKPLAGFLSVHISYPDGSVAGENSNLGYLVDEEDEGSWTAYGGRWRLWLRPAETEPVAQVFEIGVNVLSIHQTEEYDTVYTGVVPVDENGDSYLPPSSDKDQGALGYDIDDDNKDEVFKPRYSQAFYNLQLYQKYGSVLQAVDCSDAASDAVAYVEGKQDACRTYATNTMELYNDGVGEGKEPIPLDDNDLPDMSFVDSCNLMYENACAASGTEPKAEDYPFPEKQIGGTGVSCLATIRVHLANLKRYSEAQYLEDVVWNYVTADAAAKAYMLTEPPASIEVEVIDLSILEDDVNPIEIGNLVPVKLSPVEAAQNYTVEALTIRLDDPTRNTITLNGTIPRLTKIIR